MAHPSLAPEQKSMVEKIVGYVQACEQRGHQRFREKRDRLYARYYNHKELLEEFKTVPSADRSRYLRSVENGYGQPLAINFAFATVETTLPRMLSNRPRMLIQPRGPASERNVENMRYFVDSAQEKIKYELVLQDIGKDGLITGLGVQKTLWRTDKRQRKMLARGILNPLIVTEGVVTEFDGPVAERIDPINFFGDPYASEIASPAGREMEWGVFRYWRSDKYVLERMAKGMWNPLEEPQVKGLNSRQRYADSISQNPDRQTDSDSGYGNVHEVLEFHDGDRLITILDREWLCVDMPNPYWHGEIPAQLYRPTKVPGELYGIGEIEPIEDLNAEYNELRTNLRDNQRIATQQVFAYDEGVVDAVDIKFGPGGLIGVNGDPRDLLFPIPSKGIDNAGYQDAALLIGNIDRISGVTDETSGANAPVQQTATGAQLVNAAASIRIQNKTRRLEVETISPGARHFGLLAQQMIRSAVNIRIPAPPTVDNPEARYQWYKIDPLGLQGEFEWEAEGGATAPENVPQKRQDAQTKMGLLANPDINRQAMLVSALEDLGLKQPQQYLAPPPETVDPRVVQALVKVFGPAADRVAKYVQSAIQQEGQQA